jgi:hypothetical protein
MCSYCIKGKSVQSLLGCPLNQMARQARAYPRFCNVNFLRTDGDSHPAKGETQKRPEIF